MSLCPYVSPKGGGGQGAWLCSHNIYLIFPPLRLYYIHMNMNPPAWLALN